MVAQRDARGPQLGGHPVQDAAPQPRAERALGLAIGDDPLHRAVGVFRLDVILDAQLLQVVGQHVGRKARLALVEVHRHDGEGHRRALLQPEQDVQHGKAALAARQADHHPIVRADHVVVGDGLAGEPVQPLGELVVLVVLTPGVAQGGARCGRWHGGVACRGLCRVSRGGTALTVRGRACVCITVQCVQSTQPRSLLLVQRAFLRGQPARAGTTDLVDPDGLGGWPVCVAGALGGLGRAGLHGVVIVGDGRRGDRKRRDRTSRPARASCRAGHPSGMAALRAGPYLSEDAIIAALGAG